MGATETKFQPPQIAIRRIAVNLDTVDLNHLRAQRFGGIEDQGDKTWLYVSMHPDPKGSYIRMRNAKKYVLRDCTPENWQALVQTSESALALQSIGDNWLKFKAENQEHLFRLDARAPTLDPLPPPPPLQSFGDTLLQVTFSPTCPDDHLILNRLCGPPPRGATVALSVLASGDGVFLKTPNGNVFHTRGPLGTRATCLYYTDVSIRLEADDARHDLILCSRAAGARKECSSPNGAQYTLFEDELHHYFPCLHLHADNTTFRLQPSDDSWMTENEKRSWILMFVQAAQLELSNPSRQSLMLRDRNTASSMQFVRIASTNDSLSPIRTRVDLQVSISSQADIRMGQILFGELNERNRHVHTTTIWYDREQVIQTFNRYTWKPQPQDVLPASLTAKFWDIFKMDPTAFLIMQPTTAAIQAPFIRLAIRDIEQNMFLDFHLVTEKTLPLQARCLLASIDAILEN